ncbi:MAG: S16 family serine protease, partial [Thermodesulfobacteriota bacterium]
GLKEKILAAHRGRVKKVLIPKENEKDVKDIPEKIQKDIDIKLVEHMDEVISEAIISDDPILKNFVVPPTLIGSESETTIKPTEKH